MESSGHKKYAVLAVLIVAFVAVRLALPAIILSQANKKLAAVPDYKAHIGGVHLALWRGAIGLHDFELIHKGGDMAINIKNFEAAAQWSQLFHKAFVGNVLIQKPVLKMVVSRPVKAAEKAKEKGKEAEQKVEEKTGMTIPQVLTELIPFRVDKFELENGTVALRETDEHADKKGKGPEQTPFLTDVHIVVTNLTNSAQLSDSLVATAKVSAKITGTGDIVLTLHLDPTKKEPRFDMATEVQKFQLASLNDLLEWQTGLHFTDGSFSLYSEASAADGGFKGYIKPLIENLKATNAGEKKSVGQKVKVAVVNVAAKIFENRKTDEVATKVPFEGRFENPKSSIWDAVINLLRNAFIEAIKPGLDHGTEISGPP